MQATAIPITESGKVRDYLTSIEIEQLANAAKQGRYGKRDALIITMLYRHGLRTKELIDLKWDQVLFDRSMLEVLRVKHGDKSMQPINGDELRQLRSMNRESKSVYVFTTERGGPMTTRNVRAIVARAAADSGLKIAIHAHMLRHSCGYNLVNKGVDTRAIQGYLGHRNIQHTVRYTKLSELRFKGFERLF